MSVEQRHVTKSRGLITDTEAERISGQVDVEPAKRYQAISRVRRRIHEELPRNMRLMKDHKPELYEELIEVVCDGEIDE